MPRRHEPIARSSSKSSKKTDVEPPFRALAGSVNASPPIQPSRSELIVLGTITKPHGVGGAVAIAADEFGRRLLLAGTDRISIAPKDGDGVPRDGKIVSVVAHRRGVVARLHGIDSRTAAETLVGSTVQMPRSRLPELELGEYYEGDVVGLSVVSAAGDMLGTVTEIIATGANDVWVVRGPAGELLVPAVAHAVLEIDRAAGRVVVDATAADSG